jgi:hypothetical protein
VRRSAQEERTTAAQRRSRITRWSGVEDDTPPTIRVCECACDGVVTRTHLSCTGDERCDDPHACIRRRSESTSTRLPPQGTDPSIGLLSLTPPPYTAYNLLANDTNVMRHTQGERMAAAAAAEPQTLESIRSGRLRSPHETRRQPRRHSQIPPAHRECMRYIYDNRLTGYVGVSVMSSPRVASTCMTVHSS